MKDVNDRDIEVGQRVAVAFSASSSAKLRTGVIVELCEHDSVKVLWDENGRVSPEVKVYAHGVNSWKRVVILDA